VFEGAGEDQEAEGKGKELDLLLSYYSIW